MRTGAWIALAALVALIAYSWRQRRGLRGARALEHGEAPRPAADAAPGTLRRAHPSTYHEGDPSVRH